ncbi:hypothetical protein IGI04_040540 [Brassica rapa subsp. trilocularis]|uniref:Uncharacterized protein n=1 Tax=Brassica rapa subsp. trilocularis TaxID=1813537 RepID=A0ABQ7KRL7_BRACM|nr:hypothetical protein IGI04_040540 [Brassica rapa subsp. trilocularis]
MMRPESPAGLAYGFAIKRDGLEPKERKAQQKIISDNRIIYQSGGNSESVDHVEARDQPKSFTTTILQFWSSRDIYDFGQIKVFGQVFLDIELGSAAFRICCATLRSTISSFLGLVRHIKQQSKFSSIKRLSAPLVSTFNPSVLIQTV